VPVLWEGDDPVTLTNPLATKLWLFLNKFRFNHNKAQEYELESARQWIGEKFMAAYADWQDPKSDHSRFFMEWFADKAEYEKFAEWVKGKNCLEIGSGPSGNSIYLKQAAFRFIIDPLIYKYQDAQQACFGKTWYTNDMILIDTEAETHFIALDQVINGCIICRNTLDHCANPMKVLENISLYAAPGCYLLLWTDLYHIGGHDEGHHDITRDARSFRREIERLGFEIEYVSPAKEDRNTINFGCRARKVQK
jgi:SAM-dependent methyltransferase